MPHSPHDDSRYLHELSAAERSTAEKTLPLLTDRPFLWSIVTGTHQYGFTSPDSDIDVRGVYVSPLREHLGLYKPTRHVDHFGVLDDREVDCLAFEVGRFVELVLKNSGNVIEELFSPLVLTDGGQLAAFREAVSANLTRHVARHYIGFFEACVKKLRKKQPPEVKTALYAVRIALTGIMLLREGVVEAHLPTLNEHFGLDYVDDWIALKVTEHEPVPEGRLDGMLERLFELRRELHRASRSTHFPDKTPALEMLDELVVSARLDHR